MRTNEQIVFELVDIYPRLLEARGFIFFGIINNEDPGEMCSYCSWRLILKETSDYQEARVSVSYFLDSLLEHFSDFVAQPHGYIKFEDSNVSLQWTTKDIADTMLDNIEKGKDSILNGL